MRPRPLLLIAALVAGGVLFGACGSDGPSVDLSPTAADGRRIANSNGCSGCHGTNGGGGVGPPFVGLYGSEVVFSDAEPQVADEAYLVESIRDPRAKTVEGYKLPMPTNQLSDDEVAKVVQYIRELAEVTP